MAEREIYRVKGLPYFGGLYEMRRDAPEFLLKCSQLGAVVKLGKLSGKNFYLVSDPGLIHEIFLDKKDEFMMTRDSDVLKALFEDSIFMLKGDAWTKRRALIAPVFSQSFLPELIRNMESSVLRFVERWQTLSASPDAVIDLEKEMMLLTQEIIVKVMFGSEFRESVDELKEAFETGMVYRQKRRWGFFKLPMNWPTPASRKFRDVLNRLNDVIETIIDDYSRRSEQPHCLLSILLGIRDEESGSPLTRKEVREEVKTIFNTGFITTATALTWLFHLVSQNPGVRDKLIAEYHDILQGRLPDIQDMSRMSYTKMVLDETLRLYPPGWMTTRKTDHNVVLGGYTIPKNSILIMSQYASHRHPSYWEQPASFIPERFMDPALNDRSYYSYYPFGAGYRQCIGKRISITEIMMVVPAILQHFDLAPTPGIAEPWALSVLKIKNPVYLKIKPVEHYEHNLNT